MALARDEVRDGDERGLGLACGAGVRRGRRCRGARRASSRAPRRRAASLDARRCWRARAARPRRRGARRARRPASRGAVKKTSPPWTETTSGARSRARQHRVGRRAPRCGRGRGRTGTPCAAPQRAAPASAPPTRPTSRRCAGAAGRRTARSATSRPSSSRGAAGAASVAQRAGRVAQARRARRDGRCSTRTRTSAPASRAASAWRCAQTPSTGSCGARVELADDRAPSRGAPRSVRHLVAAHVRAGRRGTRAPRATAASRG